MPHRRRLGVALAHLAPQRTTGRSSPTAPAADAAARLPYVDDPSPEGIVAALQGTGCALLRGVVPPADAARLAQLLSSYTPGGEAAREHLQRDDPLLRSLGRPDQRGADLVNFGGREGGAELFGTLFQRDPAWLALVDPVSAHVYP